MKFLNRKEELNLLKNISEKSKKSSQMTIILGRRRVGKTRLIFKSFKNDKFIYFFISRKSEPLLCEEFVNEIKDKLDISIIGKVQKFSDIFRFIIDYSKREHVNVVIDEIQEFFKINKSVYSDIQKIWDINKEQAHINLIFSGSIYSIMKNIFENSKEPLFNRMNNRIVLKPLSPLTIKDFLSENNKYTNDNFLDFYTITGGIPKYIELFYENNAFEIDKIIDIIFRENSVFLEEGKNVLIEEFGKDYYNYFSILSLIASSKTSRSEIESIIENNVSGFIERLEKDYSVLKKIKPILSKPGAKRQKYEIVDNFLNFWFRFIYKNQNIIHANNFNYLKEIVKRDFESYRGIFLERLFLEHFKNIGKYTLLGKYWEKGHKNEVDIVAVNDKEKIVELYDVKIKDNKIDIKTLKERAIRLVKNFKNYEIQYKGLSLKDLEKL